MHILFCRGTELQIDKSYNETGCFYMQHYDPNKIHDQYCVVSVDEMSPLCEVNCHPTLSGGFRDLLKGLAQ